MDKICILALLAFGSSALGQMMCPAGTAVSNQQVNTGQTCSAVVPLAIATTPTIASQTFLGATCTTVATITISGAVVGVNAVMASPIYSSAPSTTNPGLLNAAAWVSAANTVSYQACAIGVLSTTPAFTLKLLMY